MGRSHPIFYFCSEMLFFVIFVLFLVVVHVSIEKIINWIGGWVVEVGPIVFRIFGLFNLTRPQDKT